MDPRRDVDRVPVPERIEPLGNALDRFEVPEVPNYGAMVDRVCGMLGQPAGSFRLFRLRMAYPVHGFQFVMTFEAHTRPC